MNKMTDVVAMAAGTILVGNELSRTDEWINGTKRYVHAAMGAGTALRQWSWFLRPFVYLRTPALQGLGRTKKMMEDALMPIVEERQRRAREPDWEQNKPDDYLQWYMDHPMEWDLPLVDVVLGVGMASLNSTSVATTQAYVPAMYR